MSQFFSQEYLKPKYFNAEYLHGSSSSPAASTRSGYWRLFFYNMQEEALKEDERKQGKEEKESAVEAEKEGLVQRAREAARNLKRRIERAVRPRRAEPPAIHPRPIYRQPPVPAGFDFLPVLSLLRDEFREMLAESEVFRIAMLQREAAANDEEEDVELLLLAAA